MCSWESLKSGYLTGNQITVEPWDEFIAMGLLLWYLENRMVLTGMFYLVLIAVCQSQTATPIANLREETQSIADWPMHYETETH